MGEFRYKAINPKGEIIKGKHQAKTRDEVLQIIISNGYSPLAIDEITGSKDIVLGKKSINAKDISIFCRQLATMLESGVSITYSISILSEQIPNKKLRGILTKINEDIRKGEELSVAMAKYENEFPKLLINMVQVGESSGTLDSIMNRMAVYYENQTKMNGKIKNAMIYPIILGIVTVGIVSFILIYLMPMFVEMFDSAESELPAVTQIILNMSTFLKNNFFGILGLIIVAVTVFKYYTTRVDSGIYMYSIFQLKYSPFKDLNEKTIVSRFARGLSTVLSAGISITNSLDIISGVLGNNYAQVKLKTVKEKMMIGESLSETIIDSKLFPPMLGSMIKIGEESGDLDGILGKTADFYDEELERAIANFTAILEPMMIVIMGVIVGFLVIAILSPMFGMYDTMM